MPEEISPDAGSPVGAGSAESAAGSVQPVGGGVPDWATFRGTLGEMGKDKSLEPIKDFNGLTKSYIEAQKMIGNSIRLPGKDVKPEYRKKAVGDILGRLRKEGIIEAIPESPDKYNINMPTVEGWKPNEPLIASFKEAAHKAGIPPSQVQGMFDWYLNFQEESQAKSQADFETMKRDMKRELGGLYTRRMEAARRAVAKYIGADGDDLISQLPPQIGRKLVLAFAEIGDPLLEDSISVGGVIPGVHSKEQVKAKLEGMLLDKANPLNDVSHPKHKQAVEEYTELNKMFSAMK
jgi:hypothetical protein